MKLRFWKTLFILKKCTQQHFKLPLRYFLWHPSVCASVTHSGGLRHAAAPWQVEGYIFFFFTSGTKYKETRSFKYFLRFFVYKKRKLEKAIVAQVQFFF